MYKILEHGGFSQSWSHILPFLHLVMNVQCAVLVVHPASNRRDKFDSHGSQYFSLVKQFVMDKERTMRANVWNIPPSLHDRTGTLKCCLSVCWHFFQHAHSSVASIWIDARLARYEAPVLGKRGDFFKMVLNPVVRRLLCFECQGVDDSCWNFTYIPAKLQPRHNWEYTLQFLHRLMNVQCAVLVGQLA